MDNRLSKFSLTPSIKYKRNRFRMPCSRKTSLNAGMLVPLYCKEILPGDSIEQNVSAVLRGITPKAPVLDNAYIDLYAFFVPNRLVWDHWEKFLADDTPQAYTTPVEYSVPQIKFDSLGSGYSYSQKLLGSFWDYVGIGFKDDSTGIRQLPALSALYPRAYVKVWNDWFRDENVMPYAHMYTDDVDRSVTNSLDPAQFTTSAEYGITLCPVSKYHDYFTSALPQPQKHSPITLPIGTSAPVTGVVRDGDATMATLFSPRWYSVNTGSVVPLNNVTLGTGRGSSAPPSQGDTNSTWAIEGGVSGGVNARTSMAVTGTADLSQATAVSVNAMRLAFQTQRFYERLAICGSRYTELLQGLFGVYASDARLQRAEFLGGKRIPIQQYQVAQTAEQTQDIGLGDTGAFTFTASGNNHLATKSFTEHGIYFVFGAIRTDQTYCQGVPVQFTRRNKFDFYFPVFAHIGEQPIYRKEIYAGDGSPDSVFGYKEPWAEYRYDENMVTGRMRPWVSGNFGIWSYANNFSASPQLNSSFIIQDQKNIDRTIVVPSSQTHQFFGDFYFDTTMDRVLPVHGVPGLIDHY